MRVWRMSLRRTKSTIISKTQKYLIICSNLGYYCPLSKGRCYYTGSVEVQRREIIIHSLTVLLIFLSVPQVKGWQGNVLHLLDPVITWLWLTFDLLYIRKASWSVRLFNALLKRGLYICVKFQTLQCSWCTRAPDKMRICVFHSNLNVKNSIILEMCVSCTQNIFLIPSYVLFRSVSALFTF